MEAWAPFLDGLNAKVEKRRKEEDVEKGSGEESVGDGNEESTEERRERERESDEESDSDYELKPVEHTRDRNASKSKAGSRLAREVASLRQANKALVPLPLSDDSDNNDNSDDENVDRREGGEGVSDRKRKNDGEGKEYMSSAPRQPASPTASASKAGAPGVPAFNIPKINLKEASASLQSLRSKLEKNLREVEVKAESEAVTRKAKKARKLKKSRRAAVNRRDQRLAIADPEFEAKLQSYAMKGIMHFLNAVVEASYTRAA